MKDTLRDLKRLESVKLTCLKCGRETVSTKGRANHESLWERIGVSEALPVTWDGPCETCGGFRPHFVDWPSHS